MDTELKTKWVTALRSGKYQQGMGALEEDGRYCCLGVLADITGLLDECRSETPVGYDPLNKLVGEPIALPIESASVSYSRGYYHLTMMNDHLGKDFNHIADWIEKYL